MTGVPANQLDALERIYKVKDRDRVLGFLEPRSFLLPVLVEAAQRVAAYFPDAPLSLDVQTDPEDGVTQDLMLSIGTQLPPADALSALHRFDHAWWLQAMDAARGQLHIDVDVA